MSSMTSDGWFWMAILGLYCIVKYIEENIFLRIVRLVRLTNKARKVADENDKVKIKPTELGNLKDGPGTSDLRLDRCIPVFDRHSQERFIS